MHGLSPVFSPLPYLWFSPALAERGLGVNAVRARLESIGTVLQAVPRIAATGVTFEFLVASQAEAGRVLFAQSRTRKQSTNDADRLKKYLTRFGLSWEDVRQRQKVTS